MRSRPEIIGSMTAHAMGATALLLSGVLRAEPPCATELVVEETPNSAQANLARLYDAVVIAADDIWAVGEWTVQSDPPANDFEVFSLTMHFTGSSWSIVDSPSPETYLGDAAAHLYSVDAVSSDEVYAAGAAAQVNDSSVFILRWDGSAWTQLFDEDFVVPEDDAVVMEAIDVLDESNIWFAGGGEVGGGLSKGVLFHFDGNDFVRFTTPVVLNAAHRLRAVSALSPNDVWAAGAAGGIAVAVGQAYVVHYDGSTWTHVPTPDLGVGEIIRDILALAPDDVWVCGSYDVLPEEGGPVIAMPLFLHWNGSSWTQFEAPAWSRSLVALAPDDIYGLGGNDLVHWDGESWSLLDSLEILQDATFINLQDIEFIDDCRMVGVGMTSINSLDNDTLAVRLDGESIFGDLNGDQHVDEQDRSIFCGAIGAVAGEPMYMVDADFNGDASIDQVDQQMLDAVLASCGGDVVAGDTFAPPRDGVVDGADLAVLLGSWGASPSCADFVASKTFAPPPDGVVDGADLAFMLGSWGPCK